MDGQEILTVAADDRIKQRNQSMFTTEVNNGAELLNKKIPGWENEIDINKLDMKSCARCILGQLYGEYFEGIYRLGLNDINDEIMHGFSVRGYNVEDQFSDLNIEWIKKIFELKESHCGN